MLDITEGPVASSAITVLGLVAGCLTTAAFLPQFLKAWHLRQTRDISLSMYITFCCGVLLCLVYGVLRMDIPVIAANGVTLLLAAGVLALKIRFG